MKRVLNIFAILLLCASCTAKVRSYRLEVVNEYPHDSKAYTQGLFFRDGQMYESTGQFGQSSFRKVDFETGKVLRKLDFGQKYFGEGSVMLGERLYMLTWKNKVAFVYNANTLEYEKTYSYPREGWGLTTDGNLLFASDGSNRIYVLDAEFKLQRTLNVAMDGRQVRYLNELEWIDGKIWANVYTTDLIVIIDPKSGEVVATVDCTGLLPRKLYTNDTDVLNGIAYNPESGKIYLTGKNWPKLYEIKLVEKK